MMVDSLIGHLLTLIQFSFYLVMWLHYLTLFLVFWLHHYLFPFLLLNYYMPRLMPILYPSGFLSFYLNHLLLILMNLCFYQMTQRKMLRLLSDYLVISYSCPSSLCLLQTLRHQMIILPSSPYLPFVSLPSLEYLIYVSYFVFFFSIKSLMYFISCLYLF